MGLPSPLDMTSRLAYKVVAYPIHFHIMFQTNKQPITQCILIPICTR